MYMKNDSRLLIFEKVRKTFWKIFEKYLLLTNKESQRTCKLNSQLCRCAWSYYYKWVGFCESIDRSMSLYKYWVPIAFLVGLPNRVHMRIFSFHAGNNSNASPTEAANFIARKDYWIGARLYAFLFWWIRIKNDFV